MEEEKSFFEKAKDKYNNLKDSVYDADADAANMSDKELVRAWRRASGLAKNVYLRHLGERGINPNNY